MRDQLRQRPLDAVHGLEQDNGFRVWRKDAQAGSPRPGAPRQKSLEQKAVGGQSGHGKGRDQGIGAWNRNHPDACGMRRLDEREPRVTQERRSGVANQRNGFATLQPPDQYRRLTGLVVIVVGNLWRFDAIMR